MNRIEIIKSAAGFFLLHRRRCLAAVTLLPSSCCSRLAPVVSPSLSHRGHSPPSSLAAVTAVLVAVNVASYLINSTVLK